jgi:hypothetical protein
LSFYNSSRKVSHDHKEKGKKMAQRCAYLVNIHNISLSLVVNIDQTRIHLILRRGVRT